MPQLHDIQHSQCDSKIYTFVFLCVAPPFSVSIGIPFSHSLSLLYLNYSFLSPPPPYFVFISFPQSSLLYTLHNGIFSILIRLKGKSQLGLQKPLEISIL